MSKRIYVGNLSFQTTADSLREAFSEFGEVTSATVISDRETGRSRGFGFVEMAESEAAAIAIEAMHGQEWEGRSLNVNEARERESRGTAGRR